LKLRNDSINSYKNALDIAKKCNDVIMRKKCLDGYNNAKGFL